MNRFSKGLSSSLGMARYFTKLFCQILTLSTMLSEVSYLSLKGTGLTLISVTQILYGCLPAHSLQLLEPSF